jgi:hypothetical protein
VLGYISQHLLRHAIQNILNLHWQSAIGFLAFYHHRNSGALGEALG